MAILDANYYVKEEPIVFMSPSELDNRYQAKKNCASTYRGIINHYSPKWRWLLVDI